MDEATILLHRGAKFAARGAGLFVKDVMHDGNWIHPVTNKQITVTPDIRMSVQKNMAAFLKAGNKVPMPDGHTMDTERNKGFWPGPFVSMGEDVLGLANPLDEHTKKQMADGSADAVSVCWYPKYMDSTGQMYDDIFEHICLTNYPVITKQRKFIALSGKQADEASPFLLDRLLQIAAPEEDEALLRGLEKVYDALRKGAADEINKIITTPAEQLAKLVAQMPRS